MLLSKIVLCSVVCVIVCIILRQFRPDILPLAVIAAVVCVIFLAADDIKNVLAEFNSLISDNDLIGEGYTSILIKVLLIAVISRFSADFCRDNGFSVIASNVELIGKIFILSFCFPIIKVIVELIQGLLV